MPVFKNMNCKVQEYELESSMVFFFFILHMLFYQKETNEKTNLRTAIKLHVLYSDYDINNDTSDMGKSESSF